jgi:hypothetical protein
MDDTQVKKIKQSKLGKYVRTIDARELKGVVGGINADDDDRTKPRKP